MYSKKKAILSHSSKLLLRSYDQIFDLTAGVEHQVACTRVNRVMLITVCTESIKPVFEGDKI